MGRRYTKIKQGMNRVLVILLVVCMFLSAVNIGGVPVFAADEGEEAIASEEPETLEKEETSVPVPTETADESSITEESSDSAEMSLNEEKISVSAAAETAKNRNSQAESIKCSIESVQLVPEDGSAVADDWGYKETRTLTISADFTGVTGDRILQIELPTGMVFRGYPTEGTDSQILLCKYEACKLPAGYTAAAKGGTLTYTIKPSVDTVSLQILISYDEQLWNKQAGVSVTGSPDKAEATCYRVPVKVTKTADGTKETRILSEVRSSNTTGNLYTTDYNYEASAKSDKPLDKAVFIGLHYFYNGRDNSQLNSTPKLYWKKMTLVQEAPYKLDENGDKIYANYEEGASVQPIKDYQMSYDPNTHITTVVWENNGTFSYAFPSINGKYSFPKISGFNVDDEIVYPQPVLLAQGIYGEEFTYSKPRLDRLVKFKLGDKEELKLEAAAVKPQFLTSEDDKNVAYFLSTFLLSNIGAGDSGEKQLTYTFEGRSGVGVTSMRLVMPKRNDCILNEDGKVEVTCTALDENGDPVEDYTAKIMVDPLTNDTGRDVILSRNQEMIEKNYYFHTVAYQVKVLRAGTIYYNNSSPYMSGGAFYGKLTGDENKTEAGKTCLTATLNITSVKDDGAAAKSYSLTVNAVDETRITTMGFVNKPLAGRDSTISAGGTLTVSAELQVSDYPYHSTSYISHPVFYLRLPEGLSLVEGSLETDRAGASPIKQDSFQEKDKNGNATGYTLTPINFGIQKVPVGYYDETLGPVGGRKSLTLTFTLQASKDTATITQYDLRDLVCAGDQKVGQSTNNSGWNPYNWSHAYAADRYSQGEFRATYSNNSDTYTTFTVQAAAPTVDFSAEVKEHKDTTDADYGKEMTFIDNKGSLDYRLSFSNNKGGTVDGSKFYYLIQLPKNGAAMSGHMTNSAGAPEFDFSLKGPAVLKSERADLYDLRYSFDSPSDGTKEDFYNNDRADFSTDGGHASYYTAEQIGKAPDLKWEDVRCIKLVVKDNGSGTERIIPNGESCSITLEDVQWNASGASGGTDFSWSACGMQRYNLGERSSEGHTPTKPVIFHIHPFTIDSSATLTGVKEGNPTEGTTKTAEILIPAYRNSKKLKVLSVSVSGGISLVSSSAMADNKKGDASWGDKNFTLKARLDSEASGTDADILGEGDSIGSTSSGVVSRLIFTLDHAELMSTQSKAGIVTVVIGDGADVRITETITIRTIGTEMNAEDLNSAVVQGKSFSDIGLGGTQIKITSDNAVSVQFNLQSYLHTSYGEPYIEGDFPAGAALILANVSNSKQPIYYYYQCLNKCDQISLSEFISMRDGAASFDYKSLPVDSRLIFVLDYAQAVHTVTEETARAMKLIFPKTGEAEKRSLEAGWEIAPKREFVIAVDNEGMSMMSKGQAELSGSLRSESLLGNDVSHALDYLTMSLTLYDETGDHEVDFPLGTTITANGRTTGTAENKAILSLGQVKTDDIPFSIKLNTSGWGLAQGVYTVKVELYYSRAEGYISAVSSKTEAEKKIRLEVTANPSFGLKVSQTDGGSRLAKRGVSLQFKLDYKAETEVKFSAKLYEKTGAGAYNEISWEKTPDFSSDTAAVYIPDAAEEGRTYRILFAMTSGDETIEVPYNIMISD